MPGSTPYQRLSAAGQALLGTEILDTLEDPTTAQGERFIAQNRAPLELARAALRERCEVALEYDKDFFGRHLADLQALRMLGRSFVLEAGLHSARGDWQGAVCVALDLLHLAAAARRGGLHVDALVGVALEANAIEQLQGLLPNLGAAEARELARALCEYDAGREPFAFVASRERIWDAHVEPDEPLDFLTMPWPEGDEPELDEETKLAIRHALQEMTDSPEEDRRAPIAQVDNERLLALRKLAIQAALAGFHAGRNGYPESLSELVPDWLPAIPVDPFGWGRLDYRKTATGYDLAESR